MLFHSVEFIIFLPIMLVLYYLTSPKHRWLLLLVASYYFYLNWKWPYIFLILSSTIVDYVVGHKIANSANVSHKKGWLFLSLTVNLGLLFSFKYINFFEYLVNRTVPTYTPFFDEVLLPIGISFYTFQTLSYSIDIYRGKVLPEKHFGKFALFVSFFPQLVAGPIERASQLLPQFVFRKKLTTQNISTGIKLMFWGFFQKLVIADNMAKAVDAVYGSPENFSGWSIFIATLFFSVQIYADFSGYTDIARGAAKLFGINLSVNFRQPYLAHSLANFWHRWHITFSQWLRDYIYISLGGNRVIKWRWYYNIFLTFAISGLWHGAAMGFVIWGSLHGLFYITEQQLKQSKAFLNVSSRITQSIRQPIQIVAINIFILLSWIFFRAESVSESMMLIKNFFGGIAELKAGLDKELLVFNSFLVMLLFVVFLVEEKHTSIFIWLNTQKSWLRWTIYYSAVLFFLLFADFNVQEFIYFQF